MRPAAAKPLTVIFVNNGIYGMTGGQDGSHHPARQEEHYLTPRALMRWNMDTRCVFANFWRRSTGRSFWSAWRSAATSRSCPPRSV